MQVISLHIVILMLIIVLLAQYIPPTPGDIVDLHGQRLGQHTGFHTYTIGQRVRLGGLKHKMFVARKNKATNEIVVVDRG